MCERGRDTTMALQTERALQENRTRCQRDFVTDSYRRKQIVMGDKFYARGKKGKIRPGMTARFVNFSSD